MGEINGVQLLWASEESKTCHKCGSTEHLVIDCQEKQESENFKQRRQGFSKVYSQYKVPNYRNLTGINNNNNNNNNTNRNNYLGNTEKHTKINEDSNKAMMEMLKTINNNINEMKNTIQYINSKLIKVEKQIGIKTPPLTQGNTNNNSNENNNQERTINNIPIKNITVISSNQQNRQIFTTQNNNKGKSIENNPTNQGNNNNSFTARTYEGNLQRKRSRHDLSHNTSDKEENSNNTENTHKELNDIKLVQNKLEAQVKLNNTLMEALQLQQTHQE